MQFVCLICSLQSSSAEEYAGALLRFWKCPSCHAALLVTSADRLAHEELCVEKESCSSADREKAHGTAGEPSHSLCLSHCASMLVGCVCVCQCGLVAGLARWRGPESDSSTLLSRNVEGSSLQYCYRSSYLLVRKTLARGNLV